MVRLLIGGLVTAACFYYGIIYENTAIITLGYALNVIIGLSILEVVYRYFTIKCFLEIPITMTEQNTPVTVRLRLKNKGFLPTGRVDVRMCVRNSLAKKGKIRWFHVADAGRGNSNHEFKMVLYGAGSHEVELIKLRVHSMFGLCSMTKRCKDFGSILILPEIHSMVMQVSESTRNFMGDADVFDEFRPGHDPGEIFEIREYRQKDKLQSIHWKLSAKADNLMVKEQSLPKACAIVLLMDLRDLPKKQMADSIAGYLELTASLSFCLMDTKTPHFIAWLSKETGDVRRIRVDDEESFYLFLSHYLRDGMAQNEKDLREEYRSKYRNEWYLHDLAVNNRMELYKDGELTYKIDAKKIKDECEKMELLL